VTATRGWAIAVFGANLVVLLFTLCWTPVSTSLGIAWAGYGWDDWHAFVLPHLFLALLLTGSNGLAAVRYPRGTIGSATGDALQPFLVGTFWWAMVQFGGDDSGGMGWSLFMSVATAAPLVLSGARTASWLRRTMASGTRTIGTNLLALYALASVLVESAFTLLWGWGWLLWLRR